MYIILTQIGIYLAFFQKIIPLKAIGVKSDLLEHVDHLVVAKLAVVNCGSGVLVDCLKGVI